MAIKVASYNLWDGSSQTYNRLVDFVKAQQFDVLCLQEINGWQDESFAKLNDFTDKAGFTDYEYGNSNSEYKLATLSSLPIVSKTVHQEGFWHCVIEIHVKVGDTELVIFNVHLDPWKEDPRVIEIERLLNKVDPNKQTIITGDFNSLSKQDQYPPEFLTKLQENRFYKFGQDELDYRVTDSLAKAGFVDIAAHLGDMDVTTPTPYGESDNAEKLPVTGGVSARIDYVFVSSNLVSMVKDYTVIKSDETSKISDHYPIVLTLDIEPQAPVAAVKAPEQPLPTPQTTSPAQRTDGNTSTEGELIIKHDDA